MRLQLLRTERLADGVFGELIGVDVSLRLVTMEDDWRENAPRISCIPAGIYLLKRTIYHKHNYETFEVTNVKGRSRILIHPANTEEDVEGCIGVGMRRGFLHVAKDEDTGALNVTKNSIVQSNKAFQMFMGALDEVDEADLEVLWLAGLGPSDTLSGSA